MSRCARRRRLLRARLDPRAWAHLVKIVNYYNYAHVEPRREMRCGEGVRISPVATFANARHIEIGPRALVGENSRIWAGAGGARVVVGADTLIGPNVLITAASYRFRDGAPIGEQAMQEADVIVGADVWIGAGAIVLMGSVIGEGSVVAAGSVVRGAFGPHAILAGNPARDRAPGGRGGGARAARAWVRLHSTLGGTCGYTLRRTMPSASRSRSWAGSVAGSTAGSKADVEPSWCPPLERACGTVTFGPDHRHRAQACTLSSTAPSA